LAKKMKILVVDDDLGMCETLSDILEDKGYEVVTATDGRKAVEEAIGSDIQLVLMDIKMPGMNGVEACKVMKKEKPNLKVILMTAYAVESLMQEALRQDGIAIFFKPLDIEKVINLLQDVRDAYDAVVAGTE